MISVQECIAFAGLDPHHVAALAGYEIRAELSATTLTSYLLNRKDGAAKIREMLVKDILGALNNGEPDRAGELFGVLRKFLDEFPVARVKFDFERKPSRLPAFRTYPLSKRVPPTGRRFG